MPITIVTFPFDGFGNSGTSGGATLLADVVHEILHDLDEEQKPTRQQILREQLHFHEERFHTPRRLAQWLERGQYLAKEYLNSDQTIVWLGGNHLSVLPVYQTLTRTDLVVQCDAHLDCYDLHDIEPELTHGNFLRSASCTVPVVNLGHRDLFLPPESIARYFHQAVPAEEFHADSAKVLKRLAPLVKKAERVWIDIDVDVFEPAIAPAVHQPSPGGLWLPQVLSILRAVPSQKILGLSISEFDPGRDRSDTTLNLLGWFLEWFLLRQAEEGQAS
ncbi:MAG: arginase family protein [Gemmataceae bacterium]